MSKLYTVIVIFLPTLGGRAGEDHFFNEEDWASEEESIPYEKSKLMAERAAWELVKNLPGQAQY